MADTTVKAAIVDLGSNSLRLLLGTYDGKEWHNEPKRLWTTRLGKRAADGQLTEEAMTRSLDALKEIQGLIGSYGATRVVGWPPVPCVKLLTVRHSWQRRLKFVRWSRM